MKMQLNTYGLLITKSKLNPFINTAAAMAYATNTECTSMVV